MLQSQSFMLLNRRMFATLKAAVKLSKVRTSEEYSRNDEECGNAGGTRKVQVELRPGDKLSTLDMYWNRKEKQHKYPVTGMTMGPCAIFVKDYFAKNSPRNLSEGKSMMREAAAAWKTLDEATKKKYEGLSKRYRDEKIHEFEALSDEEKNDLITSSLETKQEKERRRIRRERREKWYKTGHPEKPPTSYNLFVQEKFNQLKDRGEMITPVVKTMSRVSAEWKAMDDSAKEPYVAKAAKMLDEYKSKLSQWKLKSHPQEIDT